MIWSSSPGPRAPRALSSRIHVPWDMFPTLAMEPCPPPCFASHPSVQNRTVAPCPVPQAGVSRVSYECQWGPTCSQGPPMFSCSWWMIQHESIRTSRPQTLSRVPSTLRLDPLWSFIESVDLNRDLSRKEGLRGQPRPGVDSHANVSAWSRPSVVAAHTAVSPGFCTPTRRFQDWPSQGDSCAEVPGLESLTMEIRYQTVLENSVP